jgi:hypothetical protein
VSTNHTNEHNSQISTAWRATDTKQIQQHKLPHAIPCTNNWTTNNTCQYRTLAMHWRQVVASALLRYTAAYVTSVWITILTLNVLMSYIYGAPNKARNLTSYIYGRDFLLGFCFLNRAFR